ncbi:hypothetical protein NOF04DRAFT_21616 [Fusarium oxysporum II5]|uniref:Uncharacterized protein n=1 Tax=Fusarium odoratissimum (strain NRRL 54006) TaxID=1089451 RepID=X0KZ84_FUSO5|nr:uncharacterized protein FOIG_06345 [Fusarium odoratissimum NRRL 54006]EXM02030.1 hypothetical protein FOIG_06345 [Fusarium odoratissimum NRRL 54006]KAK2133889.1 hypothetical protein NOF04DRAFT_21616 [Fusarium oxysporum II5]
MTNHILVLDIKSQTARQSLFKTPRWPFRITPQMTQDSHPSSCEYAESRNNLKREKRKTAMRETKHSGFGVSAAQPSDSLSFVPQVPLPTLNSGTEIPSNGSVAPVSQPPSTVPSEINAKALARLLPQTSCEHQQCQGFWELAGGTSSFESPINGPFQMKLPDFAPMGICANVSDWWRIKSDFLPLGLALTVELSMKDDKDADFDQLLRFWGYMRKWLSKVYDGESRTLCYHLFDSVASGNGSVRPVSEGLDHLYMKHRELCGIRH